MIFVDTNVFFYAQDAREQTKRAACRAWLIALGQRRLGRTNLQVVNEFTDVALRKRRDIEPETVFRLADEIEVWGATPLDTGTVRAARFLRHRTGYSWWDCLLLASAVELGCTHFLSEDLQDGRCVEDSGGKSLTILSPFAHSPEQFFSSR